MKSSDRTVQDHPPECGTMVESEGPGGPSEKRPRRWRRRLKRIGIVLLLIFAGVNGWLVQRTSRELRTVQDVVDESGGFVSFYTYPITPSWLPDWLSRKSIYPPRRGPLPLTVIQMQERFHKSEDYASTDRLLNLAGELPGLLYLHLEDYDSSVVTDKGMTHFRRMNLYELSIGGRRITDAGVHHLSDMTSLRMLALGVPEMTDGGLAYLSGLENLKGLRIYYANHLTDAGLGALRNMKNLEHLTIGGASQLTGQGFVHLADLKNLTDLSIGDTSQLRDAGLANLKNIRSLEKLSISGASQLTGKGFVHLEGLKNLRGVYIRDAPRLTKESIMNLRSLLPKAEIEINGERVAAEE